MHDGQSRTRMSTANATMNPASSVRLM
jgi:hypothetical protein